VFGRGGEEVQALVVAGVPYEVVPGVSTLTAVPALAGIPLTSREVAAQLTVVTGTNADGSELDSLCVTKVLESAVTGTRAGTG